MIFERVYTIIIFILQRIMKFTFELVSLQLMTGSNEHVKCQGEKKMQKKMVGQVLEKSQGQYGKF